MKVLPTSMQVPILSRRKRIHEELSKEIIGAAMTVLNELKPGLDEKLYERALVIELRERGRKVNQQKRLKVFLNLIYSSRSCEGRDTQSIRLIVCCV